MQMRKSLASKLTQNQMAKDALDPEPQTEEAAGQQIEEKQEKTYQILISISSYDYFFIDLLIEHSETFINNPSKAASMCTEITRDVSDLVNTPAIWKQQFVSESQQIQNRTEEKLNYFLQNCIFIIENYPEFNKIILHSLTNLGNITEPSKFSQKNKLIYITSFGERTFMTLVRLYKTNSDLRKQIEICITNNVFPNIEKQDFRLLEVNILKGLICFMEEVKIASWFSAENIEIFGMWYKQICDQFLEKDEMERNSAQSPDRKRQNQEEDKQSTTRQPYNDENETDEMKIARIDAVLEFISLCCQQDRKFNKSISEEKYIDIKGSLAIINRCQKTEDSVQRQAELQKQNNRILVFVLEILRLATSENKTLYSEILKPEFGYERILETDLKISTEELQNCEWDYRQYKGQIDSFQQVQVMNKKLGGLIRAYAQLLINPKPPEKLSQKEGYQCVVNIYKEIQKIDPYIYGSLCDFIVTVLPSENCFGMLTSSESLSKDKQEQTNLQIFLKDFQQLLPVMCALESRKFVEMLRIGQTYGQIIMYNPGNMESFQNMSIKEVQYAYQGIAKVYQILNSLLSKKNETTDKVLSSEKWWKDNHLRILKEQEEARLEKEREREKNKKDDKLRKKHTEKHQIDFNEQVEEGWKKYKKDQLERFQLIDEVMKEYDGLQFKTSILNCMEAPNEDLRVAISKILLTIPIQQWKLTDLRRMVDILRFTSKLLESEMGEEEISAIMIIFCQLVQQPDLPNSKQFMESTIASNIVELSMSILKIDMARNTLGDEDQTKQKVQLAISCVFLLRKCSLNKELQLYWFRATVMELIRDCIMFEDRLLREGPQPVMVEKICYNISPLLQTLESTKPEPVKPHNLVAFRVLMQISFILDTQCFRILSEGNLQSPDEKNKQSSLQPKDLIKNFEQEFYQMCLDQWNSWRKPSIQVEEELGKLKDDLASSFEVQHTIFAQQKGIERILTCLKKLLDKYKQWALIESQIRIYDRVKDFFKELSKNRNHDHMDKTVQQSSTGGVIYHKHALHQKLVGYGEISISPLRIVQFNEQFFETIQEKKTTANSMIDIQELGRKTFLKFIKENNKSQNAKIKVSLVTSALLYCCYSSMKYAPNNDLKFPIMNQILSKNIIKKLIILCASSDWCNANVALKLLKIYRIILKHVFLNQNIEQQILENRNKDRDKDREKDKEQKEVGRKGQKKTKPAKIEHHSFYKIKQNLDDQVESLYYVVQMIEKVLSDFKEIIECLSFEQLLKQLKLLNGIFKSLQCVFKFYLYLTDKIYIELKLSMKDYSFQIYKMLSYINSQIMSDSLVQELTICVERISLGRHINKIAKSRRARNLLDQLFYNISVALGQLFTLKRYEIKKIFSLICEKFKHEINNDTLMASISSWKIDLATIKLFANLHPEAPRLSHRIPITSVTVDMRADEVFGDSHDKIYMVIYFDGILFIKLKDWIEDLEWLYTQMSNHEIKILYEIQAISILDVARYVDDKDEKLFNNEQNMTNQTEPLTEQEEKDFVARQKLLQLKFEKQQKAKGFFEKNDREVKKEQMFIITFPKAYVCRQVYKIINSMRQNRPNQTRYYKFD